MTDIRVEISGVVGYLTLAQPKTLNALSADMVIALKAGLQTHESNPDVALIVIRSDSERAFCAGGDMKRLRQFALQQDSAAIASYFQHEYALNLAIAECSKPYVALIDGVAMGGGLGVSVHGNYRIVTEHAVLAMPETRIGFFPDVGGSYFLPRLPHRSGYWLALTAAALKGFQAVSTGLATHYVPRASLPALVQRLEQLPAFATGNTPAALADSLKQAATVVTDEAFDECLQQRAVWFQDDNLDAIESRLNTAAVNNTDAQTLLTLLRGASPYSLAITLSLFERTAGMSLSDCLKAEHALAVEACHFPDLVEGVRAVLVDKDRQPAWLPYPDKVGTGVKATL